MPRLYKHIAKAVAVLTMLVVAFGPLSVVGQTPVAQAADCTFQGGIDGGSSLPGSVPCSTGSNSAGFTNNSQGQLIGSDGKLISNDGCSNFSITLCLSQMVYAVGPGIATWVASWAAYFFNFIVRISLQSQVYSLTFLTDAWTLVLSLANMFFIFILIYAAFVIMLKAETARTLQTLAWVIAIALVVNFSFFFTRVVIDAGNILGVQFYNAVAVGVPNLNTGNNSSAPATPDITQPMMQAMGLWNVLSTPTFNKVQNQLNSGWGTFIVLTVIYLFAAVMFWVLAIALLMVGLKFFLRVVGLWLVLIASPLAFVAQTLGNTRKFFDMWLRTLVSFSMYPAVFLFMFWVLDKFVTQLASNVAILGGDAVGEANFAAASAADTYPLLTLIANISIRMMFIIMLLYVMLKVADWVIEQAGGIASTFMNRGSAAILGGGLRTAANLGAFAGRNTAGRAAYGAAQSAGLKNWAANSRVGNALWRGTSALSRSTFDARNSANARSAGGLIGTLSRTRDVDVGRGSQRNFAQSTADKSTKLQAQARALGTSATEAWNRQQEFAQKYDEENGKGSFNTRLTNLQKRYDEANKNAEHWNQAAALDPNLAARFKDIADINKKAAAQAAGELSMLKNIGKNMAQDDAAARIKAFADRLDKSGKETIFNAPYVKIFEPVSHGAIEAAAGIRAGEKAPPYEARAGTSAGTEGATVATPTAANDNSEQFAKMNRSLETIVEQNKHANDNFFRVAASVNSNTAATARRLEHKIDKADEAAAARAEKSADSIKEQFRKMRERVMDEKKSSYERMGVKEGASLEEIKAAFRNLAKELHPDAGGDTEAMQELNKIYDELKKKFGDSGSTRAA